MQGFKAVNDNISHAAGDEVLHRHARLLGTAAIEAESVQLATAEAQDETAKHRKRMAAATRSSVRSCKVYRVGGDELALICAKSGGASFEQYQRELEGLSVRLAAIEVVPEEQRDSIRTATDADAPRPATSTAEAPLGASVCTFPRIGVAHTWEAVDILQTDVRTQVYLAAFGSLQTRGATINLADVRLRGVSTWTAEWIEAGTVGSTRRKASGSDTVWQPDNAEAGACGRTRVPRTSPGGLLP